MSDLGCVADRFILQYIFFVVNLANLTGDISTCKVYCLVRHFSHRQPVGTIHSERIMSPTEPIIGIRHVGINSSNSIEHTTPEITVI